MKKKSFIREILIYLIVLAGLMFTVLCIFLASSYEILETEIKDTSDAFLQIYGNEFRNTVGEFDSLLKNVTAQREDLAKIKSSDENERSLAAISLHNSMNELLPVNRAADALVVYDGAYDICLDMVKNTMAYQQKMKLREFCRQALAQDEIRSGCWDFVALENDTYLYKMIKTQDHTITVFADTEHLLTALAAEDNVNRAILLVNQAGNIGKLWGKETTDIHQGKPIHTIAKENYYRIKNEVVEGQLYLYCYTGKSMIFRQTHAGMFFAAAAAFTVLLFILFLLRYTRKKIAAPMLAMVRDMERIKSGEYDNRIAGSFDTQEFQLLQETTNQMIDEMIGLKIKSYEKKIALQEMELKSIRLQLKPHFFLNALTTISSLSAQQKNRQIVAYIAALSKNIRYMFRAGFHTVALKEEICHVENYFEMQELKYPDCIFYLIDLPQELEDWKIPQMLIHTFIENEYKYAVSMDETLTILIKVKKQIYMEEEMLLIEIEDDGKGYPLDVLSELQSGEGHFNEKGSRIGLWSIKRMLELMYERKDLLQLLNAKPHGCMNRIYIPREAKHELSEETIQTKI